MTGVTGDLVDSAVGVVGSAVATGGELLVDDAEEGGVTGVTGLRGPSTSPE